MTLLVMERANLYAGMSDNSLHLELVELKLPAMVENYIDHRAGGAVMGIEIDVQFNKLESTFRLAGWDTQVASLVAAWQSQQTLFTAYGLLRDYNGGGAHQAVAQMVGRLGVAEPQSFRVGDQMTWEYSIKGIMRYSLVVDNQNVYYWDFMTNVLTVGANSSTGVIPQTITVP